MPNISRASLTISIHASREGSDNRAAGVEDDGIRISIHASREGSDSVESQAALILSKISIHASREGSDRTGFFSSSS